MSAFLRVAWLVVRKDLTVEIRSLEILSTTLFFALTVVLFVVIGALLEGLPALLIFGPILFPISRGLGVDPVHYGIVIIAAMGIAFFLPPVGVGLSIACGIAGIEMDSVLKSYLPYLVALLVGLALIAAFPSLTLLLPRLLLGYAG